MRSPYMTAEKISMTAYMALEKQEQKKVVKNKTDFHEASFY